MDEKTKTVKAIKCPECREMVEKFMKKGTCSYTV